MINDDTLAEKFRQFVGLARRIEDERMKDQGVSLAQSHVMEIIQKTPRARWSDIAAGLGFSPRTITEAIELLERNGLVSRCPDPDDRRAKVLNLTPRGTQDLVRATRARNAVRAVIFNVLKDDEKQVLFEMLERMRIASLALGSRTDD